jgi:hypothetical protein
MTPAGRRSGNQIIFDILAALNALGLLASSIWAYAIADWRFSAYTILLLGVYLLLWTALRRYEYPLWAMIALQISVLGHLAGRLVVIDGATLYTTSLLGIGTDKIIHAVNSAAAAIFVTVLFARAGLRLKGWEGFIVVMVVSGLGATIEIIEYGGMLILPRTNVGDLHNNMRDLVANVFGAVVGWALIRHKARTPVLSEPEQRT